ncbi:hypothetical protein RO21_04765 [[Actinobacillus] muris]|uniref:Pseudouridine synthase n=1 Tax=Muribacter muris TaxID=67855 RepID=A0A0J5P841_9PAST|nr:hypothetical protein [Muribacter muris]KMK51664.1 hypothetical protein RO21_04765 [[Actinobacillus] muris] [Muribacter muris]
MKKSLVALAFLSASVFASSEPQVSQTIPQNAPVLRFGVVDTSNKIAQEVGLTYSIANKHHELCWTAFNLPFQMQNKVVEVFISPKAAQFTSAGATVAYSKDKKTHTITTMMPNRQETVGKCWRFDKNDPLGKYKVDIRVDDIIFPTQTFELVK